jgi:hypothetical protein
VRRVLLFVTAFKRVTLVCSPLNVLEPYEQGEIHEIYRASTDENSLPRN